MAPPLRTRRDKLRPIVVAGLIALALLGLGEAAPGAFPVAVSIEARSANLTVDVDGETHQFSSVLGGNWQSVTFEQPGPLDREYQIDGSDVTSTHDRPVQLFETLVASPLYRADAWLRDEASYSRWERAHVVDLTTGADVPIDALLPDDFRITAVLRRPEAAARIWLNSASGDRREGLELDRDRRNARWLIQRGNGIDALPRWFFPEEPAPFAAELLNLLGRAAAAGYGLLIAALTVGALFRTTKCPMLLTRLAARAREYIPRRLTTDALLGVWLVAAAWVTARLYHQLPHILDAVSYTFQAGLFSTGKLSLPAVPMAESFRGPFELIWQGRMFSQYPPGTPAAYALGRLIGLEWLVGPLACLALIACTSWTAAVLFGRASGISVVLLGVLSPFVLFQAGSYLSHPIAAGLLAGVLAAFVAGEHDGKLRWYEVSGALLGAAFVSREAASLLFALPLGIRLLARREWRGMLHMALSGLPFALVYLVYNQRLTGDPFLLPRAIFSGSDHFGFGDGIGFHMRHTLAAGLANTDELLTLLQFDLFGWPPLFALGLLGLPMLLGLSRVSDRSSSASGFVERATDWDVLAALGFLAFVVAYVAYFYHGIALGPRYYFEAMPWLLLLAARGVQLVSSIARSALAVWVVLGALSLNTLLFYLPAEVERRTDLSGLPNAGPLNLDFVQSTVFGPRLAGLPSPALIVTDDWWLFNTSLAALNCPTLPDCGVLFALAPSPEVVTALQDAYPGRTLLRAVNRGGQVDLLGAT